MPQGALAQNVAQNPAGFRAALIVDAQGAQTVAQRHGKYFEGAYAGSTGWAANPTAVTTSAGLATTYVGICLSNPANSGMKLVVQRVSGIILVAPATVTGLGLIVGFAAGGITAHTTALTVGNSVVGTSAPALVGLVDSACTLVGTPAWERWLSETPTATTLLSFTHDLDGDLILPPGAYCAIGTTIAGPASGFQGAFKWEEVSL